MEINFETFCLPAKVVPVDSDIKTSYQVLPPLLDPVRGFSKHDQTGTSTPGWSALHSSPLSRDSSLQNRDSLNKVPQGLH